MHNTLKLLSIAIIIIVLATADSHAVPNEQTLESWPDWVSEAMAKETKRLKFRTVEISDGSFSSKLPGKPGTPEAFEGGWYFPSDIKTESPFECYIWNTSMDMATLASLMAENSIENLASNYGDISERTIFDIDAGEVAGIPYLALEWLYLVQGDTQALAAFTKVRAAVKGNMAFACIHSHLGYRETFAKGFAEFVSNAVYEDTSPVPYYEEIAKIDMAGMGSGIAYTSFSIDEDGDIKMDITEASITAVNPSTIVTGDSYTISYMQPDGALINSHSISVENGDITGNLTLQYGENDMWISSGTTQGKEINVEIDGTLMPTSELEQIAMAKELFAGDETSFSAQVWGAEMDPTQFIETTMTRDDAEVPRQAILTLGPLEITGRFDADGNMRDADIVVGPASIEIHRLWSNGSLER